MKRPLTALVLAAFVVSPSFSEDADFTRLKQNYKAAADRAVAPINQTYLAELRKLLERQTKASDLDGARITMEEIEKITAAKDDKAVSPAVRDIEKLVTGRTFKHVGPSTAEFKRGGEGVKIEGAQRIPFVWRVTAPGMVEAVGAFNPDGTHRTFYYKFNSLRDATYGDTPDATNMKLTLVE
ncbi:hypothetical protein AYO49_03915 [Verrucomicrobiaceae bacterium SCGC AG-212-N21]|nr:hypothetical protein AYO49_03915 [Verrucomicrobiaceae bacterium SCGC AG-212-N21]